ncbi:MAG: 1-acyl-sn-glycerol-3-phosphate acyltransferase, partial [Vibrio sp.]
RLAAGQDDSDIGQEVRAVLKTKLAQLPEAAHTYLLDAYANPVRNHH